MNILIIRLSSIGDILLTTAFIRQTRRTFPEADIDFVIKKKFAGLIHSNPHINRVYEYNDLGPTKVSDFAKRFTGSEYDYIFDLHNNLRSIYLRHKINAKNKYYIRKNKLAQIAFVKLKNRQLYPYKDIPQRYLDVGHPAGISDDGKGLEIFWNSDTETGITNKFNKMGIDTSNSIIGLAPGAGYFTKRWPVEYFARLVGLINEHSTYNIAIIGGDNEKEISRKLEHLPGVYNLCGKLSIIESGIAISKFKCLVSNDSGMMHMATAVNTPVLALFGSSVKEFGFYPYRAKAVVVDNKNAKCRPCSHVGKNKCPQKHFNCMQEIKPEEVYRQLINII